MNINYIDKMVRFGEKLPKRTDHTSWAHPLSDEHLARLRNSFSNCEKEWAGHGIFGGVSLSSSVPGKSIWLHDRLPSRPWMKYKDSSINELSELIKQLSIEYNLGNVYGRAYAHRLQPGNEVSPHVDENDWNYFQLINRYQLYLDIWDGITIKSGGPIEPNSILLFRHDIVHSYTNASNHDLLFVVFDTYIDG